MARKRVGAAICRRLHAAGANLMVHFRSSAGEARLLQAELNHVRAGSVALIQADLLDIAKLPSLVQETLAPSAASTAWSTTRRRSSPRRSARSPSSTGTISSGPTCARRCSSRRRRPPRCRKTQGAIVNITDIHAERPLRSYVVYSVAKAGLSGLTRALARELAPEIRVNAVAPGPVLWPEDDAFDELSRQRIISHTPLKREGTPEDIAKAVHYLLAEATYVTGETHNVDGGRHVAI